MRALERDNGTLLAKLEESPFYPEGGGQVSDTGVVETPSGRARVLDVFRLGDDQALALEPVEGEIARGRARPRRRRARRAARDDAQPHRHPPAARRAARAARHPRAPGRLLRRARTSCASTSPTASGSSAEELPDVEARVNGWIADGQPVRAIETTPRRGRARSARWRCSARSTATGCGWSRSTTSRASCAAAPTCARTAEIGLFHVTTETSSASNVRRIEAVTGPGRRPSCSSERTARAARARRAAEGARARAVARGREADRAGQGARRSARRATSSRRRGRAAGRGRRGDRRRARSSSGRAEVADAKALLELSDRVRQKLGDAAVVLGAAADGRVHLVANVAPGGRRARRQGRRRRPRGRAGRRRRRRRARHDGPGRRPGPREARRGDRRRARRDRVRARIESMRVLALDHGEARCGCAVSDPSGTLATPLEVVERPDTRKGLDRVAALARRAGGRAGGGRAAADARRRGGRAGAEARAVRRAPARAGRACRSSSTTSD